MRVECDWKYKCEYRVNNICNNLEWCNHQNLKEV